MNAKLATHSMALSLVFVALSAAGCSSASGNESGPVAEPNAVGTTHEAVLQAGEGDAGASGRHHGHHHHGLDGLFKRFDKDGDGKVALSDLPEKLRDRLASADTNGDGFLTRDEMKAARQKFLAMRFQRLDSNGDGFLTAGEVGDKRWEHLKNADTNGDGKIDENEFLAFAPHGWHARGPA